MKNFFRKTLVIVASAAMALSSINFVNVVNVTAAEVEYEIYPIPQDIEYKDGSVTLGREVAVSYDDSIDVVTRNHTAEALGNMNVSATGEADVKLLVGSVGQNSEAETFVNENGGYSEGLMDKIDSHVIVVKDDTIAVLGSDTDGAFYGLTTLKHIIKQADGEIRNLVIEDYADTRTRGFIEGYYGIPWSDEDRMSLMEFGGEFKMTSYIFAPKDDPYHSSQWRDPYPAERLEEIAEMVKVGNDNKCRFVWTIHPFMHNRITEENYDNDLAAITAKFEQLYGVGVRQFGVLADDSGNVARTTVIKLMNDLQAWVDAKGDVYPLSFCPQGYNHSWQGDYGEINQLDANFHEEIDIFWTGEAVCKPVSQETLDHFRTHNNTTGKEKRRAPLFWLNWPVNDINMKRLMMGKGVELHADVNPEDLSGVVTNPMQEAEASKVALFAVADYSWNVNSFDDDTSWANSFKYIDENAGDALHIMAAHLSDSAPNGHSQVLPESEYMVDAINDFKTKFVAGASIKVEGEALIAQFKEVAKACDDFDALSTNENLKEEINSWRLSLKDLSNAIINYIEAAIALEEGDNSNVWANYSEANALFARSKEYTRLKIHNVIDTVEAGAKVLIPFANTLSTSLNSSVAGILDPSKVIATFITNREDTPTGSIDNVFDNDPSTEIIYKTPNVITTGEYVGVQYNRVITMNDITFRMGANSNPEDTIIQGKIQYMNASNEWVDLPNGEVNSSNKNLIEFSGLTLEAKGIRIIATADKGNTWFGVKDIIVNKDSIVKDDEAEDLTGTVIYNNATMSLYEGPWENLVDGNNSSYAWSKNTGGDYMAAGDYVGINLGSAQRVGLVTFVQDNGDLMPNLAIDYYDGSKWVEAATLTGCGTKVEYNLEGVTASQVRIRNTVQTPKWWKAYEVSVKSFTSNKYICSDVEAAKTWSTTITDDTFALNAGQSVSVPAGSYVGLDLQRLHLIDYIDCPTHEGFVEQWSLNGEVWEDVTDVPYSARYVRLYNNTDTEQTLTVNKLQVGTIEIFEPHVEDTNFSEVEGAANLFDKNRNTETVMKSSQTEGLYVTYDFGQEIFLETFKAVSLDSNIDWVRHGKVSVSADNENWVEIMTFGTQDGTMNPGEDTTTDNINDVLPNHEVTYNTKEATEIYESVRYFKFEITQTKGGSNKWTRFTEFEINNGEDFPYTTDPTVETMAATSKEYSPLNVQDGDYASSFRAIEEGKGSLVYTLDEDITRNSITILQSPTNAQDAMVKVYYYDETLETQFALVGSLSAEESLSKFVLPYGTKICAIEVHWEGKQSPEICEIILGTDKDATTGVDLSALDAKLAEVKAIEEGDYSPSTYGLLQHVIEAAENGKALLTTEEMVNGVIDALDAAVAQLSTVDTSQLEMAILFAEMVTENEEVEYGPIGYAAFEEVLASAREVLATATSQDAVDAAVEALVGAMENLVYKPSEVIELKAKATNYKTITLTWTEDMDATAYNVYRKGYKEGAEFELVDTVEVPKYVVSGVMTGKEYTFYVEAVNANEVESMVGEPSNEVACATTLKGTVTLAMEQVSTSKFKLSWNEIDGATRYIVYRKRNDDKMKKVLTLGGDVLEYTTAEMPNGDYQFQVKAGRYDSTDRVMTGASNKVEGTVEALKPTVTATAGTKSAKISWKKMEGVTHYQVYRATSSSGKYTKLTTTKELSYTAKSLTKGKKYYFKVRGYKTYKSGTDIKYNVYTPYSSVKSVTAK